MKSGAFNVFFLIGVLGTFRILFPGRHSDPIKD